MTEVQLVLFTADEARALTDEVKADAAALWAKLLRLYEGGAHTALGYSSWAAYCAEEFDMGQSRAYQLLDAGRVVAAIESHSTIVESPSSEAVARELVPLRDEPDELRVAWSEAVEEHGEKPTAAEVREVVERRRGMDVHYSSERDDWATPQEFFNTLDAEFGFELDVCALPQSAKCKRYFTPEDDGLTQNWTGTCWMNPPYGDAIVDWVRKAHDSAALNDATVVCLVPARVDTGWWWDYCRYGEIRFLRGRLKFGDGANSAPFPSAVVVFGRKPRVVWWER